MLKFTCNTISTTRCRSFCTTCCTKTKRLPAATPKRHTVVLQPEGGAVDLGCHCTISCAMATYIVVCTIIIIIIISWPVKVSELGGANVNQWSRLHFYRTCSFGIDEWQQMISFAFSFPILTRHFLLVFLNTSFNLSFSSLLFIVGICILCHCIKVVAWRKTAQIEWTEITLTTCFSWSKKIFQTKT